MSEKFFFNRESATDKKHTIDGPEEYFFEETGLEEEYQPEFRELTESETEGLQGVLQSLNAPNIFKTALAGVALMFANPAKAETNTGFNSSDFHFVNTPNTALGRANLFNTYKSTLKNSWEADELANMFPEQIKQPTALEQEVSGYIAKYNESAKGRNEIDLMRRLAAGSGYGTGDLTYQEYLSTKVDFIHPQTKEPLPERLQEKMRELLVGQAKKESSLNIKAVSSAGAIGMLQQLPSTIADEGYSVDQVRNSLPLQAEITGRYFARIYDWVQEGMGSQAKEELKRRYSNEEIETEIMPVVLLVGYIAGHRVASEVLRQYFADADNSEKELVVGDFVVDLLNFGKESNVGHLKQFGSQTREYATKIMAFSEMINKPQGSVTKEEFAMRD